MFAGYAAVNPLMGGFDRLQIRRRTYEKRDEHKKKLRERKRKL